MLLIRKLWLFPLVAAFILLYTFYRYSQPYVRPVDFVGQLSIRPERHPVKTFTQLPTSPALPLPRIQHDHKAESENESTKRLARQAVIKEAFLHSWNGYKQYAWAQDEIAPLSGTYRNPFGGWGASLVDTMDTLWIMGLKDEFEICVRAVKYIDFTTNTVEVVNVFETTIRYLGGLLSAYDVSDGAYPALLDKAVELATILYITFDTPNRLPVTRWHWKHSAAGMPLRASKTTLLAEIGSMSLEFTRLAQLTGDAKWFDAVNRITDFLYKGQSTTKVPGLWPTFVDAENELFTTNHFTLGGMADSTAEYLPKQYMILGGLDERYREMYEKLISTAKKHIFYRPLVPGNRDILFSGNTGLDDKGNIATEAQGQHLTCFASGMVGIGSKIFDRPDELAIARRLMDGCVWAYNSTPTGLMPETFHVAPCHIGVEISSGEEDCEWSTTRWYEAVSKQQSSNPHPVEHGKTLVEQQSLLPGYTKWGDNRYILRPEVIESVFIMYRLTGDSDYLEVAWRMWDSISEACRTPIAFAGISDVRADPPAQSDRMESFWLAETLKYFYLIFAEPNEWTLDEWVLNTEAHFLRRPKAGESFSAPPA